MSTIWNFLVFFFPLLASYCMQALLVHRLSPQEQDQRVDFDFKTLHRRIYQTDKRDWNAAVHAQNCMDDECTAGIRSTGQLVEALVQRRCYKSKIKDGPLWIKNCNQTENRSQRRRSEAPRAEIQLNPATQSQTQTRLLKKHGRDGAYGIWMENDRHLLEQLIALGCILDEWNKHSGG